MKKIICLLLVLVMLVLTACGQNSPAQDPASARETPTAQAPGNAPKLQSVLPGSTAEEDPPEEAPADVPTAPAGENETLKTAKALVYHSVAELYEALGEPDSAEYAPSCSGSGEDGELHYGSVTIFTQRNGSEEIIVEVEG